MKPKSTLRHILFGTAFLITASALHAQTTYYWNQNDVASGWGTGGAWNTSSAFFSTINDPVAAAAAATTTTLDTLNIGTATDGFAGGTLTLAAPGQSIGSIITGSANTTAAVAIDTQTLTFAATGTITNNSSQELVIGSIIAGAATRLDLNATGGITMAGAANTYTGITYVNSGTVTTNNAASLGASGADNNRTVVVSGARVNFNNTPRTYTERFEIAGAGVGGSTGALNNGQTTILNGLVSLSGAATIYNTGTLTVGGGIALGSNALTYFAGGAAQTIQTNGITGIGGSLIKTGGGVLNLNIANSYTGNTTISGGTLQMTGSFIESSPIIYIGNGAKLKNTTGSITLQNGSSIIGTGATGSVETIFANTNSVTALGNNTISNNNSGTLTLNRLDVFGSDNQITAGSIVAGTSGGSRGLVIGNGSSGTLTITGGSFTSNNGSNADVLGNGAAGDGTLIINGGSYTTAQTLSLGLNTSASGTLTLTTGSADIGTLVYAAANSGGSGIVNLNGGSMTINTITSTSGATRQFNFNGGQFIASGNTSFANTLTLNVQDGGAKINTNGNSVSILGNLLNIGAGGLTKSGGGPLTLSNSNTYTGTTAIDEGTLVITGATQSTSAITFGGGVLGLDTATPVTAASASVDFTGQSVLVTGPTGDPSYTLLTALSIPGTAPTLAAGSVSGYELQVVSNQLLLVQIGGGSPYDTWATSKGLTGLAGSPTDPAKDADPDNDGRNNLAEFAFNGDPLSGSDNGKVFVLTEDSDFDGDALKELILTIAVRTGTPVFAGSPSPSATQAADGITYSIEGSLDLASFPTTVNVVPTPITTGLPAAGTGYEYRSFSLDGSNGLSGKGFLRAKVTSP